MAAEGPGGDALLQEVRAALETLAALSAHRQRLGRDVVAAIEEMSREVEARLGREQLGVLVVGANGSGKTTFANALLGERLLPSIARGARPVILIRRSPAEDYRARFADGTTETFSEAHPDETDAMKERIRALEEQLAAANRSRGGANETLERAKSSAEAARGALSGAFQTFQRARDEAERLGRELSLVATAEKRLEQERSERTRSLPALLRTRPPGWALWLWLAFATLLLVHFAAFRRLGRTRRELERVREKAATLRRAVSGAAGECLRAEGQLAQAAPPTESAESDLSRAASEFSVWDRKVSELSGSLEDAGKELDAARTARRNQFFDDVALLCGLARRRNELVEIEVTFPARYLPDDMVLIQAPAVLADDPKTERRALQLVADRADGCVLVSELDHGVSGPTNLLLRRVRDLVPHVVLLLTKMDDSFKRAVRKKEAEPWEEIERARGIGTRRFAREVGRDPGTVLSLVVAAKPVLEGNASPGFVRRFETEVATLFDLLRRERAIILGARAASQIRRAIRLVSEVEERAERSYEERIAALEESQKPEPARFRKEQVEAAEPRIAAALPAITDSTLQAVRLGFSDLRSGAEQLLSECRNRAALSQAVAALDQSLVQGVQRIRLQVAAHAEEQTRAALHEIEQVAFNALRERYEVALPVRRWSPPSIHLEAEASSEDERLGLGSLASDAVRTLARWRVGLGIGGAALGAAAGTAVLPGPGTAIGAVAGALSALMKTFASAKRDCMRTLSTRLEGLEDEMVARVEGSEGGIRGKLRDSLERSLARVSMQYDRWITAPVEADRIALDRERRMLGELVALREKLEGHDGELVRAMKAATEASVGLIR